jgi:penicillin-binding protein 1C
MRGEWFAPGSAPKPGRAEAPRTIRLRQPTPGLRLAYDPRLPADEQQFEFALDGLAAGDRVGWTVDGEVVADAGAKYRWPVARGEHRMTAEVRRDGELVAAFRDVKFSVK